MVKVQRFFKRETKQPFTYPSIEERKTSPNYLGWVIGGVLVIVVGAIIFLIL